MTRYTAAVTLESDTLPPKTYRGDIVAGNAKRAAFLALRAARGAYPRSHWRSLVIVLEKSETETAAPPD